MPRSSGKTKSTKRSTSSVSLKKIDIETERELNAIAQAFADSFVSKMFADGIVKDITMDQLLKYLSDPDNYIQELEKIANYYYMTSGEVFQLFDLAKVLPTLNYKINVLDKSKNYEKNLILCNRILNKVKHKQLTRDIISQCISTGTLTGIWLGDKKNPYLLIFDRPEKVFPAYRRNGEWVLHFDLAWLEEMDEIQRKTMLENLNPYITQRMLEKYQNNRSEENRYIELPLDRTVCIRTHTLRRNQPFGLNWALTGLYDLQHKKKLKDLEKAIANKIISAVAILTIGSDKNPETSSLKLNKEVKRKIHAGVKAALEKSQSQGITVVAIPEFSKLEFPEIKSDALDPKKFDSINMDVTAAYGYSRGLVNGEGGNYSSNKANLEIFYRRIAVLLEEIETEVYGKLFRIILPQSVADDFYMEYDKEPPLSIKEKLDVLMKLHTQEGFSLKAVIDLLSGIDFVEYYNQSIYEQEVLRLQERIKPYSNAYIGVQKEKRGRPSNDDPENDNTIRSKTTDGNNVPDA